MAFNVGSIVAKVEADISNFQDSMRKAENTANDFGGRMTKVSKTIGAGMIGVGTAMAGAMIVAGKKGVETAAEFERLQIALETVTGSSEKAASAMNTIKRTAQESPFFETASLAEFVQLMAASGQEIDQAVKSGLKFGDVAAAFGKGNAEMTRMGNTLSQVMGKGKADIVDFKELVNAGWVTVRKDTAETMGVTMAQFEEMVSAGEIGYEQIAVAAEKYNGSALAQANTFGALWNRLKETIVTTFADVVIDTGVFETIKSLTNTLIDLITRAGEAFKALDPEIQKVVVVIAALAPVILIVVGAILMLMPVLSALTGPIGIVIAIVTALGFAWATNFMGIRDKTTEVFTYMKGFIENFVMPFLNALIAFVRNHADQFKMIFEGAIMYVKGMFQVGMAAIQIIMALATAMLTGDWKRAWEQIKSSLRLAFEGITNMFQGMLSYWAGWGSMVFDKLTEPFQRALNKIREIVDEIKSKLDFTQRHSPSVLDIVNRGVHKVNRAFENLDFGFSMTPNLATSLATNNLGPSINNVVVNLDGAVVGDLSQASDIAEKIGDAIVSRLQMNVRF